MTKPTENYFDTHFKPQNSQISPLIPRKMGWEDYKPDSPSFTIHAPHIKTAQIMRNALIPIGKGMSPIALKIA